MTIQTQRLTLRPFTLRDLKTTFAYASDPENTRHMIPLPIEKKRETRQFLRYVITQWKSNEQECYTLAIDLDGKHIGAVSISLKENGLVGELGWIISKAHWGKGYATEAARAIVEFAQDELGLIKIIARCDYRNAASCRVMEKIGLALESDTGTRRNNNSDKDVQEFLYSMNL